MPRNGSTHCRLRKKKDPREEYRAREATLGETQHQARRNARMLKIEPNRPGVGTPPGRHSKIVAHFDLFSVFRGGPEKFPAPCGGPPGVVINDPSHAAIDRYPHQLFQASGVPST